ncbi:zinc-dependent alcohol dehydrogenase family protein [Actinomadura montaniterrae]|uniref:Zinc-dependent alcohol dehydrogenase family protein n=1 Tax=Actinomadura montaniterrae TaxID=1803903 RepID=A0A6L3W5F3_9ACTN|nr:zinc-dependent alcohol dehydrogenase family protein [Actinomadura montaniterrae]KAB2388229.1 zinc-dependent alcohol dehydrogenase family protein [Actinomadura montaniterrae]
MARVVVFDETGGPEVLRVVEEPAGDPGPGEVRIRLEASAVNRLDELTRSGASPMPVRLPHARLGCEGTGIIDALGEGVDGFGVGDAVLITAVPDMTSNGTYADYTVLPAARVVKRPAGLAPAKAAALWVAYSTAYGALVEKAKMRPGDTVLITAASGTVGLAAIQIANQIGAVPIAVTRRTAKKDGLLAAGAAAVIATDQDDLAKAASLHTGGAGADIVLDSVMGPGLADLAAAAKRFTGTLVTVGWLDPRPAPYPSNAITTHRYMSFEHTLDPAAVRRIAAFLFAGLRTGALDPAVDRVFALEEIVEAHRYLESGRQAPGKIIVTGGTST